MPDVRILHLEDVELDAELIHETLREEGLSFSAQVVSTRGDFLSAIQQDNFDIILSDYNLPGFDGLTALKLIRERYPAKPFIFISGSIGEDLATETLRSGATDYVLKDRPARLCGAIQRAIQEATERAERRRAEAELKQKESERKTLEDQLHQAQKMEAIGQLAGGVAHDFNNLLTIINGQAELILDRMNPSPELRNKLEVISRAGENAAALTRQLLAFSRQQVLEPRILNLNTIADDMKKMLLRLIHESIELNTALDAALKPVKADPGRIEQVIMNLVVNARDAMPKGGKITIETKNEKLSADYCRMHAGVEPGRYVMLSVSDNGHGMPEHIKSRIFEPFFTTKERGKGTGLGLSTVFGIVKQSGGHIAVDSEMGKGTTFRVYLPTIDDSNVPREAERQSSAIPRGNEVVMIVEDEEAIRDLAIETLRMSGYEVMSASNGVNALQVSEKHIAKIQLLITDVVMPEMGGPELVKNIRAVRPNIKVLFTSGYTDHALSPDGFLEPGTDFLQKPFTPRLLARKVREVLDK